MTDTVFISSELKNKSCAENIKLCEVEELVNANNLNTDSICELELKFSMVNIGLFNQVVEDLISVLDRLEGAK
jgi:hypothetical protein